MTFTPDDTTDYTSVTTTASINVLQATPTITWANPADVNYGTLLGASQLDATASVPGTFFYSPDTDTLLHVGQGQTLAVTFTPDDTTDYTPVATTVKINVLQATPTITWANPADITYGTPLDAAQLDATASTPGTFVYTPAAGTVLDAGQGQTLSVTFTPNDTTDYTPVTTTASINVLQATPTITWANPADINYGTLLGAAQLDATASVLGTFVYTPAAGTILGAGSGQTLSVTFTPNDTADYTSVTTTAKLNVLQATPTVNWANPADISFGTPLAAARLDATASVPGTFVYTPAGGTILDSGQGQSLSVTFTPNDTNDYTSVTTTATINVLPLTQKVTPVLTWTNPADIVYDMALGATQLDATASYNGNPLAGTFTYTPLAGTVLNAGLGQTLAVLFTPDDGTDFSDAAASVLINVAPAPLTITVNDVSRVYGLPNPAFGVQYSGLVNGNTASSLGGSLTFSTTATSASDVGFYDVTASGLTANNYTIQYVKGTLSITPADQTITWSPPADITYGTPLSAVQLDAMVTGSGPAPAGTLTYTSAAGTVLSAGDGQVLMVVAAATLDYNRATDSVPINVLKALPVLTWATPADISYGTALSTTQFDATASVPGTFVYTPAAGTVFGGGSAQTLSATFTPTDAADYQSGSTSRTINVVPTTTAFDLLASPRITVGTASTTLSGQIAAGAVIPTGNVAITLDGDTEQAAIDPATGDFSASFATNTLTAVGSPYPIAYAYAANADFNAANGGGTLTVSAQLGTPGTPKLDATSDTGISNSDGLTKDNGSAAAPLIFDVSETGGSGDFFRLYNVTNAANPVLIAGPIQATNGTVTVNNDTLADGTYKIAATTALTASSTESAKSGSTSLTIQSGTTLSGTNPAENGFVTALPNGQVTITFSHPLAGPNAQGVMTPLANNGPALSAKDPYAVFLLQRGPGLAFAATSGIDGGNLPLHANTIYTVNANGTSTITITPEEPLSSDVYGISVQLSAFTDLAGNTPTDPTGLNGFHAFLVQPLPPTTAPLKVVGVTTYNGFTPVNNNPIFQPDTFAIQFNKPLWQGAVNFKAGPNNTIVTSNNVQLFANVNGTFTVQPSVATYSPATDSIYLTPTGTLSPGTTYLIRVDGSVSDDQGFSGPDTNAGGTLGTTYFNTFTIINPSAAPTSALLKVADDKNGNPETLPGNGLPWGLPLGYASIAFTNSVNLSPSVFTRFSAMLDARTTAPDGNALMTNLPLNAKLAFNPNTNQLIIVPTVLPANDTYVIALSNMQSSPTNPLLDPAGAVAGVTGLPFFASFGLQVSSPNVISAAAASEGSIIVASAAPAAPVPLFAPSPVNAGTVPSGPLPSFRTARLRRPVQAVNVSKAPAGLGHRDLHPLVGVTRRPVGPLGL